MLLFSTPILIPHGIWLIGNEKSYEVNACAMIGKGMAKIDVYGCFHACLSGISFSSLFAAVDKEKYFVT